MSERIYVYICVYIEEDDCSRLAQKYLSELLFYEYLYVVCISNFHQ